MDIVLAVLIINMVVTACTATLHQKEYMKALWLVVSLAHLVFIFPKLPENPGRAAAIRGGEVMSLNLNLPTAANTAAFKQAKERLEIAAAGTGSGGGTGETYAKIDDRSGNYVFGKEGNAVPMDRPYVVGIHTFRHGWKYFEGGRVTKSRVVSMLEEPQRPTPQQDLGEPYQNVFGKPGPRNITGLQIQCLKETGFVLTLEVMGVSSENRIRNLLEKAIAHFGERSGQNGFVHPVIKLKAGSYMAKVEDGQRRIHHFDFDIVDWTDGKQLASEVDFAQLGGPAASEAEEEFEPWDDDTEALAGMAQR